MDATGISNDAFAAQLALTGRTGRVQLRHASLTPTGRSVLVREWNDGSVRIFPSASCQWVMLDVEYAIRKINWKS